MPGSVAAAILAGGCSRRMGGRDKALLPLGGRPLLQHVIGRILPQVAELGLSVERHTLAYEPFGLPQLPDPVPGHRGPLGGLLAALRHFGARREWIVLAPCDAPFVPLDLAAMLLGAAEAAGASCAVVRDRGELQPTFSIWQRGLRPKLERAVLQDGLAGFKQLLPDLDAAQCDWPAAGDPAAPPPFMNINDAEELGAAAAWIRRTRKEEPPCSA
jgi:molybdopterin-guanine dinucleotide biosynthesis protein A